MLLSSVICDNALTAKAQPLVTSQSAAGLRLTAPRVLLESAPPFQLPGHGYLDFWQLRCRTRETCGRYDHPVHFRGGLWPAYQVTLHFADTDGA